MVLYSFSFIDINLCIKRQGFVPSRKAEVKFVLIQNHVNQTTKLATQSQTMLRGVR